MISRGRHQKAEIAKALKAVTQRDGLEVEEIHRGHRWGVLRCLACRAELDIYSTPPKPEVSAKLIRKFDLNH